MPDLIRSIELKEVFELLPERTEESSKYDYGRLLAVCGSKYYRGAAALSVMGALRSGCGLVTLASVESVAASVASKISECTFFPLGESSGGTVSGSSARDILKLSKKCSAMLIGCGMGIDEDVKHAVQRILPLAECQLIIDADALNVLSECPELLLETKKSAIITPHFGEMSRLCGKSREEIEKDPANTASSFSRAYNCIVVLKSHKTYIASPDGKVCVNDKTGNAGLAKGGSGDVLAGMISSFAAQGLEPFCAAKCGVFLHGYAADRCAKRLSKRGMLPSDILTDLCNIFLEKE